MEPREADTNPEWLHWAREIQALSQAGLHYASDEYHRNRYIRLQEIAAEIIAAHSNIPQKDLMTVFLDGRGYATPKIDVRGAVFREDTILMVRERIDGGWCLPGGWADVGDLPSEMIEREVREESGLIVKAKKIIGVFDNNREHDEREIFHAYKILFLCEDQGGTPSGSLETSEARFFRRDEIPPHLSGARTAVRHLAEAFAHHSDPYRPALFD
jgi:ADP-ribose pyrophosphatase YjhB (NUDIX family)